MTGDGFVKLKEELRWRQQEERPRIIEAISEARSHGDLSENAEYHAAKEAQSLNEGRVNELEDLIARAEVIDVSKLSGDKVKFGATVVLVDEDTEEKKHLPDRRRPGSRREVGPHLDLLADRARADRQGSRRGDRGQRSRRRARLRDRQGALRLSDRRTAHRCRRRPPRAAAARRHVATSRSLRRTSSAGCPASPARSSSLFRCRPARSRIATLGPGLPGRPAADRLAARLSACCSGRAAGRSASGTPAATSR